MRHKIWLLLFFLVFSISGFSQEYPCDKLDKFKFKHRATNGYFDATKLSIEEFAELINLIDDCENNPLSYVMKNPDGITSIEIVGGINTYGTSARPITGIILKIPATQKFTCTLAFQYLWKYYISEEIKGSYAYPSTTINTSTKDGIAATIGFKFFIQ